MEDAFKYFKLAKRLNEKYKDKLNETDKDNQGKMHCRGNVKGISLVSLDSKTPEMGYSGIKTEEKFMTLISPKKVLEEKKRKNTEKILQANIIDKEMSNTYNLLQFGDNIKFIT